MTHLLIQEVEKQQKDKHGSDAKVPVLRAGYVIKVHQKIKEGEKERVQIFEGLVLGLNSGHGASKTVTVRKEVEGIGVEKIFPLTSPNIVKIEIVRTHKVRRARILYMRGLSGKAARLKEKLGLTAKDAKYYGTKEAQVGTATKAQNKEAQRLKDEEKARQAVEETPSTTVETITPMEPNTSVETSIPETTPEVATPVESTPEVPAAAEPTPTPEETPAAPESAPEEVPATEPTPEPNPVSEKAEDKKAQDTLF